MKISTRLALLLVIFGLGFGKADLRAQDLVSIEKQGVLSQVIANLAFLGLGIGISPSYDADYYLVRYTMENFEGGIDTVSGLMARPTATVSRYPVLFYMHGTTQTKFDVPSQGGTEATLTQAAATLGYVTLAPDYLNMGLDPDGFHPYVHARSEALAGVRMMQALRQAPEYAQAVNEQLFLTGYSQGGHASMALHELLIEEFPNTKITAAAHLSGPYSVSDVMKDTVILNDVTFRSLDFLPYTILGYQAVYPELDDDLTKIFRAPYVPIVTRFRDEYSVMGGLRRDGLAMELLRLYVATEGNETFFPSRLLTPEFVAALRNDPDGPYNVALRDNDTYDFVNPTPTRLFYCRADDQVNFRNSLFAEREMKAAGATDTEARDVGPGLSHTQCIAPALSAMITFFNTFQQITSGTHIPEAADWTYVQDATTLRVYVHDEAIYRLELFDALGRNRTTIAYSSGALVDLSAVPAGLAVVRITDAEGRSATRKLIVR